jgi:hypothetical protein
MSLSPVDVQNLRAPENPAIAQLVYGDGGGGGGGDASTVAVKPKTVKPFKFNSPKPHAMLNGRGQQCCEFIVTYMNNE